MALTNLDICSSLMPWALQMTSIKRMNWGNTGGFSSHNFDNLTQFIAGLQGPGTTQPLEEFILPRVYNHDLERNKDSQQLVEQDRLQRRELILALGDVASLDACPWRDFPAICELLPDHIFSRLKQLKYGAVFDNYQGSQFLQRFRSLQKLEFSTSDRSVFAWAEEEKEKFIFTGDLIQLKILEVSVGIFIEGALLKSIFHGFSHSQMPCP
jgi:hypothetical protein